MVKIFLALTFSISFVFSCFADNIASNDPRWDASFNFSDGAGTVSDASGKGNTFTLTNGAFWTSTQYGAAAFCIGGNDVLLGNTETNFDYDGASTFSAIIRFIGNSADTSGHLICKGKNDSGIRWGVYVENTEAYFFLYKSGVVNSMASILIGTAWQTDDKPHTLGFCYHGTRKTSINVKDVQIFWDGVSSSENTCNGCTTVFPDNILNNENLSLGNNSDVGAGITAKILNFKIGRFILTANETKKITEIWNGKYDQVIQQE